MTTLPQTTGIRMPRAGGSQLGPAGGGMPSLSTTAAHPANTAGPQLTVADVWRVLRANLWLILLLVGASAVGGYYLNRYLERTASVYTAMGEVRILPPQSANPLETGRIVGDLSTLIIQQNTEAQRFRSSQMAEELLGNPDNPILQTRWFKETCGGSQEKAQTLFREKIAASPEAESQLIQISMSTPFPEDAVTIVNEVVEKAIKDQGEFVRGRYMSDQARMGSLQNADQTKLNDAKDDLEKATKVLTDLGVTATGINPNSMILTRAVEHETSLGDDASAADYAYNNAKKQIDAGQTPAQVTQAVENDPNISRLRQTIDSIRMQIILSGGAASNETKSPFYIAQVEHLNSLDHELQSAITEKRATYSDTFLAETSARKENLATQLKKAHDDVLKWQGESAKIASALERRSTAANNVRLLEDRVRTDEAAKQNAEQMIRQADGGLMNWFTHPHQPSTPSFPKLTQTMSAAIMVGLILSLGIAFLREVTDNSVRSPRDIVRVGQMTLLGMIPHENDDPQSSGARLPLVIYEAPTSIIAEQLRQVRTRLQHAASLDTTRSILVTSPGPGDGKTTIACNLAAGLALNGRRILLVDANFRRPELHKIFGLENSVGFGDVLTDVSVFASAVRESNVPNLSILTSGTKPGNATELLESQLLVDFTERALEEFDHVIFDSGPMLVVSESVALAPRVDGVVSVVKARASSRGVLQRMRDVLRAVKAEHLGVVLNGVRTQAGGYYGKTIKTYYRYQNAN